MLTRRNIVAALAALSAGFLGAADEGARLIDEVAYRADWLAKSDEASSISRVERIVGKRAIRHSSEPALESAFDSKRYVLEPGAYLVISIQSGELPTVASVDLEVISGAPIELFVCTTNELEQFEAGGLPAEALEATGREEIHSRFELALFTRHLIIDNTGIGFSVPDGRRSELEISIELEEY